jgi:hypothetical protein
VQNNCGVKSFTGWGISDSLSWYENIGCTMVSKDGSIKDFAKDFFKDKEQNKEETKEGGKIMSENYHMTSNRYLMNIAKEGLIPRNGDNSQSIGDGKKVVFYSQGKEGAIVMFLDFKKHYEEFKGEKGDKVLQKYQRYQNGENILEKEEADKLVKQVEQINSVRSTEDFKDFVGDGVYFNINGIVPEDVKDKNFNFANSWTTKEVPPENLEVLTLRDKNSDEVLSSKFDIIDYFLSQISPEEIAKTGINDSLVQYISDYYKENYHRISSMGSNFELEKVDLQKYIEQYRGKTISAQELGSEVQDEIKNENTRAELADEIKKQKEQTNNKSVNVQEV